MRTNGISDRDNSRLLVSLALGPNIELTETDEDEAAQWFDSWSFSNDSTFIQILDSSDSIDSSETRNLFRHGISLKHAVIQDSISKDADNQLVVTLEEGSHEFIIDSLLTDLSTLIPLLPCIKPIPIH
ncbi:hypothetical protein ADUPG1_000088 [Aduncisulcus paluster]|uniref:Uncharacterized protein n=1 Tax=Aduncisulcus paluster TaxID=2918883 RepID=A0ABQ5K8R5_9EUKA|nr:hypothetical protein ADUPG1_000088 [Aduncisulcus paluster]